MTKYLVGKKAVIDSLKENKLDKVILQKPISEILILCKANNVFFEYSKDFKLFNNFINHQGCIGILKNKFKLFNDWESFYKTFDFDKKDKCIVLVLDCIQDPGNFGAIIRSAKAFGVNHIVFKKDNQAQIDSYVVKTSSGAIDSINFLKISNLSNILEKFKKNDFWIFSSSLDLDSKYIEENNFDFKKIVLIIGNENKGISKNLLNNSDYKIKIKIESTLDSLNVSVATGILLHYFAFHK